MDVLGILCPRLPIQRTFIVAVVGLPGGVTALANLCLCTHGSTACMTGRHQPIRATENSVHFQFICCQALMDEHGRRLFKAMSKMIQPFCEMARKLDS